MDNLSFSIHIDENTIEGFERLITSDKFTQFLLSNTTDFSVAALTLDILLKKLDELKA
jgi:hypothetical protein